VVTKIDKAIVAFVLAAAGAFGTGQIADQDLTSKLVGAVVVGLIAALGVWLTPNKAPA
jgi:energy-converting hydrogenase Eha subunit H